MRDIWIWQSLFLDKIKKNFVVICKLKIFSSSGLHGWTHCILPWTVRTIISHWRKAYCAHQIDGTKQRRESDVTTYQWPQNPKSMVIFILWPKVSVNLLYSFCVLFTGIFDVNVVRPFSRLIFSTTKTTFLFIYPFVILIWLNLL